MKNKMKKSLSLGEMRRKTSRFSTNQLVKEFFLNENNGNLPLVIETNVEGVDPFQWASLNKAEVNKKLYTHGAILFRGFNIETVEDFHNFVRQISPDILKYKERSSPRTEVGKSIYTSTDYPPSQSIQFHNEQSYTKSWPMKLWFYCQIPAEKGGETPIADGRKVLESLSKQTIEEFENKRVMYQRNYGNGMGLTWQEAFQTTNKFEVEEFCTKENIDFQWRSNEHLRTKQVFDTIVRHPITNEKVWFEHAAFFHISGLPENVRESFLEEFNEGDLPSNTYFGDGTTIDNAYLEDVRNAYLQTANKFVWGKADILLIDNMLVSHSREPFEGDRKILVAMAELFSPFDTD